MCYTKAMIRAILSAVFCLALVATAGAEARPALVEGANNIRQDIRETRQEVRKNVQDAKQEVKQNVQEKKQEVKQNVEEKRKELKAQVEVKREEFKKAVETKREELKTKIDAEREALKAKLQSVKDERKKQAVTRIGEEVNKLNARTVEHFTGVLDKLAEVLGRISSRTDKGAERGLDVAAVRTAIASADTAIASARAAVTAQAGKTYAVTITTEDKLRTDVGATRKALHADLEKVRDAIVAAREAVHTAATTLAKIPHVNDATPALPVATPTTP